MKTNPILACLLLLPLLAAAQEKTAKTPYEPGKWYAGVRREAYYFGSRSEGMAHTGASFTGNAVGTGWALTGGYRLSRHFELQAGLMPTRVAEVGGSQGGYRIGIRGSEVINDTTSRSVTSNYSGYGLYAPVSVKYIPFGAQRRFQPYLIAGIGTVVSGTRRYTNLYDPKFDPATFRLRVYDSQQERAGIKALFAAQVGIGLNVRLYRRIHLSSELTVTRNLRPNGIIGAAAAIGLLYDFAPKTAN